MASISLKLPFSFILIIFLHFVTTEAQDPTYIYQNCSSSKTTSNNAFKSVLNTLFSSLYSNALANAEFYNNTIMGTNSFDTVYGLFMCRGDVPPQLCAECVANATQKLSLDSECSLSKQAVIWYDECMVRYNDTSFFSTMAIRPGVFLLNTGNVSNQASFKELLFETMNKTAEEAAKSPMLVKKYATNEANMSGLQTLYCLAQCTPDLSIQDCRSCLFEAIGKLPWCCEGKQGGRALFSSCNIRYELYPFYRSIAPVPTPTPQEHVPETNVSHVDSNFSEDPFFLSQNCPSNQTFTSENVSQKSLTTLLSYLSSNATSGKIHHKTDVNNIVYGLFMCRRDLPSRLCGQCVLSATRRISSECGLSTEAIIWYSHCMLRYSNHSFFSTVSVSPKFSELNITNTSKSIYAQNAFTFTLSSILNKVKDEAQAQDERYKTESSKLNANQTLYTLAQCTPDLSSNDCKSCLGDIIGSSIPWCCLGSVGGRVLYPSCNLRFELFQFYRDIGDEEKMPSEEKKKTQPPTIILIVVFTTVSVVLFAFCCYLRRRKIRRTNKAILRENFGQESSTLEPLQFDLVIIEAATNNFSHENWIGRGGFGEVYKGILADGRQIAVKRLSKCSRQGADEFKNEILLIAKLQHRNLVGFIGFCLEEQEKMLVYEYVPNKSLNYFLFDTQLQKLLSWFERYNIIGGIARGILYLHEYSRLKIIHRDLKPSNVLLDEQMNPKISDFGLARIVEINQDQENTNRIVGTYGYMSPEYAMLGQFSEKSDVFSFGVIVLEIITGRKNINSSELHRVSGGLLSYVWRQWRDQTPLSILDPNIKEKYSEIEIIKCIQIGLLCVQQNPDARPTMATIVSYLSTHYSIELPSPREPAFFLHDILDPRIVEQSCSGSTPLSINQMSISNFLPR